MTMFQQVAPLSAPRTTWRTTSEAAIPVSANTITTWCRSCPFRATPQQLSRETKPAKFPAIKHRRHPDNPAMLQLWGAHVDAVKQRMTINPTDSFTERGVLWVWERLI